MVSLRYILRESVLRLPIIVLTAALMFGCADTHELVRSSPESSRQKLTAQDSFFISVPSDGVYEAKTYQGSGATISQILMAAFAKRVRTVQADRAHKSFDESLLAAKSANIKFLIFPTILEWEDRATEWSGIPDRVSIKVEIVAVSNGQTIESAVVKGRSGLATFGGDHPQDLLPKPVEEYVGSLF